MAEIKNIEVDGVEYAIKDETARNSIGDLSALETPADDLVTAINAAAQTGGGGECNIPRIESDSSNYVYLKDLASGVYILYGYFRPYNGASSRLTFDNILVSVAADDTESHILALTTINSKVDFITIKVDSTQTSGYAYTRTNISLMDLYGLLGKVGDLSELTTTATESLVAAINELVQTAATETFVENYAQPKGNYALASQIPTVPTQVSQLENDAGYITDYTETDPTVPAWAKAANKPTYTAAEVGALPSSTVIPTVPTKVSAFTNDAGYLTQHQDAVLYTAQSLTEAQKAQARANIGATAGEDVDYADSVEWLDENGDTAKKYVLPDGYIYAWMYKSESVEHNANDGTGVLNKVCSGVQGNTLSAKSGAWTSPFIAIDPTTMAPVEARDDTKIIISGLDKIVPVYNGTAIWVFYYNADGTQMFAKKGSQMGGIDTDAEITLPLSFQLKNTAHFLDSNWAQVYGVRIVLGISASGDITDDDIKNLKVNIPFFNYERSGYGWYSTGQQHSNDKATQQNSADIATLREEVDTLKEAAKTSPSASGAKWYAIGDSITYGLYSTSATEYFQPVAGQRWVDYVAQYNGYDLTNLGISGSGFVTGKTFRAVVDENDFSGVDLVTIMLGINDWKNEAAASKVGTFDDDIATGGTIVSELRYGLEKIIADNPYCKIILITPINAKIGSRGTEDTNWAYGFAGTITPCGSLKAFGDKLKEVCEYYGIQVVDMSNSSVVNRKSITTVLPDGIHPNLECYKALGLELARRIMFA